MSGSNNAELLRNANVRLCKLRVWPSFEGLGFNLEASTKPPHIIRLVESNSPAAAGGLKILDVILAVNQQDVSEADYNQVRNAIKAARDSNVPIELLVVEQRFYQALKKKNILIDSSSATVINTPATPPNDYVNFPKNQPRTCNIRLNKSDTTFGFEVVNGEHDVGAYIQEVFPNTPASSTSLRKSDRIIEIDDKYVDKDVSKSILEKLGKAKTKGAVKLYVVDTDTYKQHQGNKASLASKGKRKSQSEDRLSTNRYYTNERESPIVSDGSQLPPSNTSTLRDIQKSRTPSVPDLTRSTRPQISSSILPTPSIPLAHEDIRLCTINRADAADTFGIELNFHRKDQFHSLSITPGRDNGPSNAEVAGIKSEDRLIEINGQNIQTFDHDQVTQRIRGVKYPEPLQMLVADVPTYDYYKQQQKLIHRGLPNVRILPANKITHSASPSSSSRHSIDVRAPPINIREQPKIQPVPPVLNTFGRKPATSVLEDLTNNNPLISLPQQPPPPASSSSSLIQSRHVPIRKDSQLSNGVGFNFRTITNDSSSSTPYSHIITSVDHTNSIGTQGLRLNDYILSINDENVEYLNHEQLEDKLRRINNSETIRLLVTDGNVYRAYKQSSENIRIKPNLIEQPKLNPNLQQNRRQYRLQRNPDFEGYGFRVRSNQQLDGAPHQIVSVEPHSPADIQGLRVGDYILRVNNQTVEHMNPTDFTYLMQSLVRNDTTRDGNLLLEVMDEDTYRSINHLLSISQQYQPPIDAITTDRRTPTRSGYDSMTDEPYPRMRQCFIRPWPNYRELGFTIIQTPNSVNGGYQIQQLRLDSPAAHTHIRNGDHLIQVNNINVEAIDFQSVYQLINESYRRDGEVSLLVIDDNGYQWYKQNHYRIDPLSQRANITRHVTPEHQAVYTSTDSSVISPPIRHTPVEPMSDQREIQIAPTPYQPSRPPSTGTSNRPYTNGYVSPIRDPYYRSTVAPSVTSSLSRPRIPLSRAAVDVVDGKSMLRFCRLNTEPGQTFGFELAQEDNKHVIRHVKPESSAARAGLHNEDRLIEVNDENVTQRSHRDVVALIKNASNNGVVRLLISPSNIKPLNKPSSKASGKTKSLPSLNDERMYNDGNNPDQYTSWSPYDGTFGGQQQQQPSTMVKYLSTSRLDHSGSSPPVYPERPYSAHGFDTYQRQTNRSTLLASQPYIPTDPWPRKCVLVRDPGFHGCGFRMIEKDNYDTPIVVEVRANSPAKRSGLTEGDHIIYIETRNVQAIRSFDEMTHLIQQIFEEAGQVTLVTLTSPGYQVLKRKGGYLQPDPFDYQLPFVRELSPRLCRITLFTHEQDFGFTLQRGNPIHIKDVHPGSPAYEHGLRSNDKILELNSRDTTHLSSEQIIEIIEASKRRRQLDILVIDPAGYEFSIKHGIPLNSLLPFVQAGQRRATSSRRTQQEPVYL